MISKKIIIRVSFILTIGFASCTNERLGDKSIIKEGVGVDDLVIRTLTVAEIKRILGNMYDSINHNAYSVELFYKQYGVSFYYKLKSPDKALSISFNPDYRGTTERGFSIRNMKGSDMLRIYGEPSWSYRYNAGMIFAHYDSLGIYFDIQPKPDFPGDLFKNLSDNDSINDVKLNAYYDSAYNKEKISEISIGLKGTDF